MKLLIVDDSAPMRRVIRAVLPVTHETIECEDGDAAVAAFNTYQPDWVLMDIEMKPLDGFGAAELIKKKSPDAKIIFVTANDGPRLRMTASRLDAKGFVLKDNLEEINRIIAAK